MLVPFLFPFLLLVLFIFNRNEDYLVEASLHFSIFLEFKDPLVCPTVMVGGYSCRSEIIRMAFIFVGISTPTGGGRAEENITS